MKQGNYYGIAGVFGALAVLAGAFGAHLMADELNSSYLHTFETAARYHLVHSIMLLVVLISADGTKANYRLPFFLFLVGIILFSGSLYLLCILSLTSVGEISWLGALTPLGGLCLIAGWIATGFSLGKKKSHRKL